MINIAYTVQNKPHNIQLKCFYMTIAFCISHLSGKKEFKHQFPKLQHIFPLMQNQ